MTKRAFSFLTIVLILFTSQCSKSPDPRVVVMDFIEAVNKADTVSINKYLDLDKFTQEKIKEFPEAERQEMFPRAKERIKNNFLGSGFTRLKWKDKMIVVNKEDVYGDSAMVEVTFIDQQTGITEYTKAKLYKKNKNWLIYYIRD